MLATMLLLVTTAGVALASINEDKFYRGGQIGVKFVGSVSGPGGVCVPLHPSNSHAREAPFVPL